MFLVPTISKGNIFFSSALFWLVSYQEALFCVPYSMLSATYRSGGVKTAFQCFHVDESISRNGYVFGADNPF